MLVLVSQVKSYKYKNLLVGNLTSENNTLKNDCILKPYGSLVCDCKFRIHFMDVSEHLSTASQFT